MLGCERKILCRAPVFEMIETSNGNYRFVESRIEDSRRMTVRAIALAALIIVGFLAWFGKETPKASSRTRMSC